MLAAYQELQQIRREAAAVAELPVAQLTALTANVNRDPVKSQPYTTEQFCVFRESTRPQGMPAEAATVALALRREGQCPELILAIWPEVLQAATAEARLPPVRALRSADGGVWVLAPTWEDGNVRGGLVAVRDVPAGTVELQELDRPLLRHRLRLPHRASWAWLEADLLLLGET